MISAVPTMHMRQVRLDGEAEGLVWAWIACDGNEFYFSATDRPMPSQMVVRCVSWDFWWDAIVLNLTGSSSKEMPRGMNQMAKQIGLRKKSPPFCAGQRQDQHGSLFLQTISSFLSKHPPKNAKLFILQ